MKRDGRSDLVEIIILDDSYAGDEDCRSLAKEFGAKYIHSGQTKPREVWRIPGFAINIGARASIANALLICGAEMYHVNDTISQTLDNVGKGKIVIPSVVKDDKGQVTKRLSAGEPIEPRHWASLRSLDARLPFFMGIQKRQFTEIGGYDEDFTGVCWDDNDITERLVAHGAEYVVTDAKLVHLYHVRHRYGSSEIKERWNLNKKLYEERRGTTVRNKGRAWGAFS